MATQRIRDRSRYFRPQQQIPLEEWTQISDRATYARKFFEEKNLVYLTMKQSLEDATAIIIENRIKDVDEEYTVSETFKKIFHTPRKVQVDELVGKVKFIKELFAELNSWIELRKDLEKQEANGKIKIDRSRE